ncbi:MAG: sodium:solute symporter family protein [Fervidicoccaceae archaeon]
MISSFILMFSAYVLLGSMLAYFSRRFLSRSAMDFYSAHTRLGWFLSFMAYASTTYSAFMVVGLVGLSYSTGLGSLGYELSYLIATLFLLSLYANKLWKISRDAKISTVSELNEHMFGSRKFALFISIFQMIALIPYLSAQIQGLSLAFSFLGMSYVLGVLVSVMISFVWTVIAGMWSIAFTDAMQGIWMLSAGLAFFLFVLSLTNHSIGIHGAFSLLESSGSLSVGQGYWTIGTFLSYTIPWIFFALSNPQVVQRLFSPRSEKDLRKAITAFGIYGLLYTAFMVLIGLLARSLTIASLFPSISNRDQVTYALLGYGNEILSSFILVSIFAAAISTINGITITVSSNISSLLRNSRRISERMEIQLSRVIVALSLLFSGLFSIWRLSFIVELSVISSLLLLPTAIQLIAALELPELRRADIAIISFLLGEIPLLLRSIQIKLEGYPLVSLFTQQIIGIPLPIISLIFSAIPILIFALIRRKL